MVSMKISIAAVLVVAVACGTKVRPVAASKLEQYY